MFAQNGHLRELKGFHRCPGLRRVEIPASVELISGFNECPNLKDVRFRSNSNIQIIEGFHVKSDRRECDPHCCAYEDEIPLKRWRNAVHLKLESEKPKVDQ
jgi:hypothetical protein